MIFSVAYNCSWMLVFAAVLDGADGRAMSATLDDLAGLTSPFSITCRASGAVSVTPGGVRARPIPHQPCNVERSAGVALVPSCEPDFDGDSFGLPRSGPLNRCSTTMR